MKTALCSHAPLCDLRFGANWLHVKCFGSDVLPCCFPATLQPAALQPPCSRSHAESSSLFCEDGAASLHCLLPFVYAVFAIPVKRAANIWHLGADENCVWLNPIAERYWEHTPSLQIIKQIFADRMFPLTLEGLDHAMRELSRG